jgi:hypothetical protein
MLWLKATGFRGREMKEITEEFFGGHKFQFADMRSADGYHQLVNLRFIDHTHFEMSNTDLQFDERGSRVWHTTEFYEFCTKTGLELYSVKDRLCDEA